VKKRPVLLLMLLLVVAALVGGADRALAATCWQNYQACLGTCGSNTVCRQNCFELYNVCRFY
jgi:hypothetical protein